MSFKSFLSTVGNGARQLARPLGNIVSSLAPLAGTVLGGRFGGPMGAMMGNQLGAGVGEMVGNWGAQRGGTGNMGQAVTQGINGMIPQGMQGQTFGQMGQNLQQQGANSLNRLMGPGAAQAGFGQSMMGSLNGMAGTMGNYLSNRYGERLPFNPQQAFNQFSNMTPGGVANQAGNMVNQGVGAGMERAGQMAAPYQQQMLQAQRGMESYANPPQGNYASGGHVSLRDMIDMMPPPHMMNQGGY
jgi:hypothetical protein